jgi:hypothetical protein
MVSKESAPRTPETYRGTLAAALMRRFEQRGEGSTICLKSSEEIGSSSLSPTPALWLLRCRLAWYGFRSIKVGHLRRSSERTLVVDLFHACGTILFTVEIDSRSGAIRHPAGRALVRLLACLEQAATGTGPIVVEPIASS